MQSVYAFRQCKKANIALSEEMIKEKFSLDLNSMEVQDPVALKETQSLALAAFSSRFNDQSVAVEMDEVEEAVTNAIDSYHKTNKEDFRRIGLQMVEAVEKIKEKYHLVLALLLEWAEMVKADAEKKKNENPEYSLNFFNNRVIRQISDCNLITGVSWDTQRSLVKSCYKDFIRNNEAFIEYQKLTDPDFEKDQKIVEYLIKNVLFKSEPFQSYFEEIDLSWEENREIVKSLARKTIKNAEDKKDLELLDLSFNWEEDREFFMDLYQLTGENDESFEQMISDKSHNWDIDRVALIDKIILKLAICEMINFPSIPVKVSINEYIEIAKQYSTPKSRNYINGILDVLAEDLKKEGKIKKSGRGLIDNK